MHPPYGLQRSGNHGGQWEPSRFLQVQLISVRLIRYNHCKLIKLTFFLPFTRNGIFKLTKCGLSPKGFCILNSVTRIMVKTYNCSCNRNMYLWWCSNVYKRLQSFIWRYFYCAFLGFCFGIFDSNVYVQPRVGKFGCNWLEWFARGQGIWLQIFEKCQILTPCPAFSSPPPPSPPALHSDRCIIEDIDRKGEFERILCFLFVEKEKLNFSKENWLQWLWRSFLHDRVLVLFWNTTKDNKVCKEFSGSLFT